MAKIHIKFEKLILFEVFFSIMEIFFALLVQTIDSTLESTTMLMPQQMYDDILYVYGSLLCCNRIAGNRQSG
jgi:hypothetical protein